MSIRCPRTQSVFFLLLSFALSVQAGSQPLYDHSLRYISHDDLGLQPTPPLFGYLPIDAEHPAISSIGNRFAYSTRYHQLTAAARKHRYTAPFAKQIILYDNSTWEDNSHLNRANRVWGYITVGLKGRLGNGDSDYISFDFGGYEGVFQSQATNFVTAAGPTGWKQIFHWSRDSYKKDAKNQHTLLSRAHNQKTITYANGPSQLPVVDFGGTKVVFQTSATNLTPDNLNPPIGKPGHVAQIAYAHFGQDPRNPQIRLITIAEKMVNGRLVKTNADGPSGGSWNPPQEPTIEYSVRGSRIVYTSKATNLASPDIKGKKASDPNGSQRSIYTYNIDTQKTELVPFPSGNFGVGNRYAVDPQSDEMSHPVLSARGDTMAFNLSGTRNNRAVGAVYMYHFGSRRFKLVTKNMPADIEAVYWCNQPISMGAGHAPFGYRLAFKCQTQRQKWIYRPDIWLYRPDLDRVSWISRPHKNHSMATGGWSNNYPAMNYLGNKILFQTGSKEFFSGTDQNGGSLDIFLVDLSRYARFSEISSSCSRPASSVSANRPVLGEFVQLSGQAPLGARSGVAYLATKTLMTPISIGLGCNLKLDWRPRAFLDAIPFTVSLDGTWSLPRMAIPFQREMEGTDVFVQVGIPGYGFSKAYRLTLGN